MEIHIPLIDVERYRTIGSDAADDCRHVADALEHLGVVNIRDARLPNALNQRFQELMLRYFRQPDEVKRLDELKNHQGGWTPAFTERPKCRNDRLRAIAEGSRPHSIVGPDGAVRKDPKERFFTRVGPMPVGTRYPDMNPAAVVPQGIEFAKWMDVAVAWGEGMLRTILTVSEMAAIGFGLPPDTFMQRMDRAPHLLAPTGSDLVRFGDPATVLAGIHDDLNFLSGHAQSNYPGLFAWTRDHHRFPVRVPEGCLLMQAGQQFEHLTGGRVLSGLHEVVVTEEVCQRAILDQQDGPTPWRVSSTLFGHITSDEVLEVLHPFITDGAVERYPRMDAGEQVLREIRAIELDPE